MTQPAAADFSTFSFVFDMNQLFESFIAGFIDRHRAEVLPDALRDCQLLPQTRGASLHLARDAGGRRAFRLLPDFALRHAGRFPLLLDAKYKRLDPTRPNAGVSPADFYQMHAYARRYDCPRVLLLYPRTAGAGGPSRSPFFVEGADAIIQAATINLQVPLGSERGRAALAAELRQLLSGGVTHE